MKNNSDWANKVITFSTNLGAKQRERKFVNRFKEKEHQLASFGARVGTERVIPFYWPKNSSFHPLLGFFLSSSLS